MGRAGVGGREQRGGGGGRGGGARPLLSLAAPREGLRIVSWALPQSGCVDEVPTYLGHAPLRPRCRRTTTTWRLRAWRTATPLWPRALRPACPAASRRPRRSTCARPRRVGGGPPARALPCTWRPAAAHSPPASPPPLGPAAAPKQLYTVLEQQKASVGTGTLMGSEHTYVIPGAAQAAGPAAGKEKLSIAAQVRGTAGIQTACCVLQGRLRQQASLCACTLLHSNCACPCWCRTHCAEAAGGAAARHAQRRGRVH